MTVDDVIADVRDKMRGRTYFEGSPRHPDEILVAEIERLRAALKVCAAPFLSRPCTVAEASEIVAHEFHRRMTFAAAILASNKQSAEELK